MFTFAEIVSTVVQSIAPGLRKLISSTLPLSFVPTQIPIREGEVEVEVFASRLLAEGLLIAQALAILLSEAEVIAAPLH